MTDQSAPDSWGLSPAEIEQLAQDAVGEPDPADNEWRPAGGTLLGGVGQCLYDEIKGIIDLTKLLWDIRQEIDVAADGEDNWEVLRNHSVDSAKVAMLFYQLENGDKIFSQLPQEQQLALFRLYAKQEIVKETLKKMGRAGLSMLAAYDVYWSSYELLTLDYNQNLMKALADAVSLFFTDAEWAELAESGKALAERVTQLVEQQIEKDPWGSSGYAICLVALMISPTKIVKALRPLLGIIRTMGRATDAASLSRILRSSGVRVPSWLGGPGPDAGDLGDAARAGDAIEDAGDAASDAQRSANNQVDSSDPIETADDANPQQTPDPNDRETPDADSETSTVEQNRRNQSKGALAEAAARDRLEADGFEVFELKNGSGHGPDIIAVKPGNPPQVRVVEVKANSSTLSAPQELGGPGYLRDVYRRIDSQPDGGSWNVDDFNDFLADNGIANRDALLNGDFEIWRYKGVEADTPSSVGAPQTTPWTAGKTGTVFELDANGQPTEVLGDRRVWTQLE